MGIRNFQICLNNQNNLYYAGSVLSGNLQFNLDEPKNIRAVQVHILGEGKASWWDTRRKYRHNTNEHNTNEHVTESVSYSATEEYFSLKINLAGSSESEMTLLPGEYVYPFSVTLPTSLPSSFQGEYGHIRYFVKGKINIPWSLDKKVNKVITIVSHIDLNLIAQAKHPVQREAGKSFCCLWCRSGPLTVVLNLPFTGFVPGQIIPITLEVDNASDLDVNNVVVKLLKVIKWTVHSPERKSKTSRKDIAKLSLGAVNKNDSRTFNYQLSVPEITVFNFVQCTIINCDYIFKVELEVTGLHRNLALDVPIYLGTVPIYQIDAALPFQSTIVPSIGQQETIQPTAPLPWTTFDK